MAPMAQLLLEFRCKTTVCNDNPIGAIVLLPGKSFQVITFWYNGLMDPECELLCEFVGIGGLACC